LPDVTVLLAAHFPLVDASYQLWDVWPESPSFYHLKDDGILWTPKMVVSETKQFLDQAVVAKMEFDLTKQ
jgi:hypothetical protein